MNQYSLDLSLRPTTFDLWHLCMAGTIIVLLLVLVITWIFASVAKRRRQQQAQTTSQESAVKIVEKIIEVEKIVQLPAPEPVILREATTDAALQLLSLLQKDARFIDFIKEDMSAYSDQDIGAAARIVHGGCSKVISEHFKLSPVSQDEEGKRITLNQGFNAAAFRVTGNIVGEAPFTGTLVHKGWQVDDIHLPKLTEGHNPKIIAPAEVEI